MKDIDIEIINIGGSSNYSSSLKRGKVNLVIGSSSSGKSSIMRGLHFGLVGKVPTEKVYLDEIETLHLNDKSSDQALLLRNSKEGKAIISFGDVHIKAVIPSSGKVSSSNGQPKALFTTMLSGLPPTRLQQAIWKPDPSNPNDFQWIVDDLSDAGKYQSWHESLERLNQETKSIQMKYKEWLNKRSNANDIRSKLMKERELIQGREINRNMKKGSVEADLAKRISSERNKLSIAEADNKELKEQQTALSSELGNRRRIILDAEREEKIAIRQLHEAEELLENEPFEPDTSSHDAHIIRAENKLNQADGTNTTPLQKKAIDLYLSEPERMRKSWEEFSVLFERVIAESGDETLAKQALIELNEVRSIRDNIVSKYLNSKRKFGDAEQRAAKARAAIKSARAKKGDTDGGSSISQGQLTIVEKSISNNNRTIEAAKVKIKELKGKLSDDDPEAKEDTELLRKIEKQLSQIDQSQTFEFRFISLGMAQSDSFFMSEDNAKKFLGIGQTIKASKGLVQNNLGLDLILMRDKLKSELDNNLLSHIEATSKWAAEEADRQRQETRRVFNKEGTSMFTKLQVSDIKTVSLDTSYEIRIEWKDGGITGLTGAGGERTIIAAALLLAMRKSYTPEIPILMFDGVLENLDERPREELLNFLENYAESENIAVIVSLFDSAIKNAKIIQR